jgi:hypothetical protein
MVQARSGTCSLSLLPFHKISSFYRKQRKYGVYLPQNHNQLLGQVDRLLSNRDLPRAYYLLQS